MVYLSHHQISERKSEKMKKILSIALALVMVLSVAAFSVSAENYEEKVIEAKWNFGYVGSSTNASWTNKINPTGANYSYTDVIDMGPAGSTITFADEASSFASASAYVFSFWKKEGEEYVIDTEAANVPGGFGGTARSYTFTTTEANQAIRVCYRSEEKADFTPVHEDIYIDGVKVEVKWNFGYVGSSTNSNWADKVNPTGGQYSYTDVIVVPNAGSKVTFTDTNKNGTGFCSNSAYVFSTWTKSGEEWQFVSGVPGAQSEYTDAVQPYSYTSTKDNELVRLCYNSGETADAPIDPALRPVVTLKTPVAETPANPGTGSPETGDSIFAVIAVVLATMSIAVAVTKKRSF
jgi:hypothetical protein